MYTASKVAQYSTNKCSVGEWNSDNDWHLASKKNGMVTERVGAVPQG